VRQPTRISILGTDGTGPAPNFDDVWQIVIPEAKAHFPDFDIDAVTTKTPWGQEPHPQSKWCIDRVMERFHVYFDAAAHNELVAPLARLYELDHECRRAVDEANQLYDDLDKNTTINWLAAHHRFTKATIRARAVLTDRADLTDDLTDRDPDILKDPNSALAALYYTAHVPEDQRIQLPTKADAGNAKAALIDFTILSNTRFDILRATLTGAYPPGFAPALTDTITELTDDTPISPAVAYANQAMRIPAPRPGDPEASARSW
jgi:hypothetical protein